MIQRNHHADLTDRFPGFRVGGVFGSFYCCDARDGAGVGRVAVVSGDVVFCVFGKGISGRGPGEAPEIVYTRDRADEVAIRHIGQSGEVGMLAAGSGDVATGFQPLAGFLEVRVR